MTMKRFCLRVLVGFSSALIGVNAYAHESSALPDLGDDSAAIISPTQERQLGAEFMHQARKVLSINTDAEINSYIQTLGMRLVRHADAPIPNFHFFVVNDTTLNAFSVPGGYVGVHTGIIEAAHSEDELAAVLAHEISHITQRHIQRLIAQGDREQLPTLAAIIAAILLASSGAHVDVGAITTMAAAAQQQSQLTFGRSYEEEADRIGLQLMVRAGYDPRAMPTMFERLLNWSRLNETSAPEFLRTHPLTTSRISDTRNRAERYPPVAPHDQRAFLHMQAKAEVLSQANPREAVTRERDALKANNSDVRHYAYAVALVRAREFGEAQKQLAILLAHAPDYLPYRLLRGDFELVRGNTNEALAIFRAAQRLDQHSDLAKRRYAEALLQTGSSREARTLFRELVVARPDDPSLQQSLSRASGEAGFPVEAHRALAEYYFANGDNDAALIQLDIAKRAAHSSYEKASLKARADEIKDHIALLKSAH